MVKTPPQEGCVMNGVGFDVYSIKPFLLDSVLAWCAAHSFTPILISTPHAGRTLPDYLHEQMGSLAFNVGARAITDKQITTQHMAFYTYFKDSPLPQYIVLPVESWASVRVKETGQTFDLSFVEHLDADTNMGEGVWPAGIVLHRHPHPINSGVGEEKGYVRPVKIAGKKPERPSLSLVWNDGPVATLQSGSSSSQ